MPTYKLTYFNLRARAEVTRFIFAQAGVEYEDIRIERKDWPKYKPKMPFYQMPMLEEDDKVLAQSEAIAMYLARKFDLAGENDWEAAKVEELIGVGNDLISAAGNYVKAENAEEKKQAMIEYEKEHLVPIFKRLNEALAKNGTGYFVGKKLTAGDLAILHILDWMSCEIPSSMNGLEDLKKFHKKIASLPAIKKYMETRPKTAL